MTENFNRLSRAHERYRQTTDRQTTDRRVYCVARSLVIALLKIFPLSLTVKEFEKSVHISQSYRYKFASYFLEHSVHYL